jgi:hypothetical protein
MVPSFLASLVRYCVSGHEIAFYELSMLDRFVERSLKDATYTTIPSHTISLLPNADGHRF